MRYPALLEQDDGSTVVTFPDCPGCVSQADEGEDASALAADALAGWLESHLAHGEAPPRPSSRPRKRAGAKLAWVPVDARLAVRIGLRWARQDAGLTQAQLARRMKVSPQQIAKFENPDTNLTLETISRIARSLGVEVDVAFRHVGDVT
jgi:antitoxin HicB